MIWIVFDVLLEEEKWRKIRVSRKWVEVGRRPQDKGISLRALITACGM